MLQNWMTRFGRAAGDHRAFVVGELVSDWVGRSLANTFHLALGKRRRRILPDTLAPDDHPLYKKTPMDVMSMLVRWVKCALAAKPCC